MRLRTGLSPSGFPRIRSSSRDYSRTCIKARGPPNHLKIVVVATVGGQVRFAAAGTPSSTCSCMPWSVITKRPVSKQLLLQNSIWRTGAYWRSEKHSIVLTRSAQETRQFEHSSDETCSRLSNGVTQGLRGDSGIAIPFSPSWQSSHRVVETSQPIS